MMTVITADEYERLAALEQKWVNQLPRDGKHFDWQPFRIREFDDMLMRVIAHTMPGAKFLDAGCGVGTKMEIAHRYGLDPYGIELRAEYVHAAMAEQMHGTFMIGDAATFANYADYDIVYLSHPMFTDADETEFEWRVHKMMRPGTFLIAVWACVKPPWEIIYRATDRGVWRKPLDGKPVKRVPPPPVPKDGMPYREANHIRG